MRGVHLFMFIVALPALAALGHDCWLYYNNQDHGFELAKLGFIWTKYEPESYKQAVELTSPDYWKYINMILDYKAVVIGAVFAGFFYVVLGILRMFRLWPFNEAEIRNFTGNRKLDEMLGKKGAGSMKYKRK